MKKTTSSLNIPPIAKRIDLDAKPAFFDPEAIVFSLWLGHAQGKTILNRFLTLSRRFATIASLVEKASYSLNIPFRN